MLKVAVFLITVASVLGSTYSSESLRSHLDGRIVGGNLTTISLFPWQVSLQLYGVHSCGASIYSEKIIITAAHCLHTAPLNALTIRAGSTFWNSGGFVITVANFKYHEEFNPNTVVNDIGVIRLESSLKFSSTIKPILLATAVPRHGDAAVISGWGKTNSSANSISTVLQYVKTSIIDKNSCRDSRYGYGKDIYETMICAAAPGKDACQNDSGGPMVSDGLLIGVISWGVGCANPIYPGVFTNIALVKPWIERAAKTV